jgi:hypothetical protein
MTTSGSVAGGTVAAAHPGERAACAKSHEKRQTRCRPSLRKSAQKQPSDGQYLPLALDSALKRMPIFAGKRDQLRRLCL